MPLTFLGQPANYDGPSILELEENRQFRERLGSLSLNYTGGDYIRGKSLIEPWGIPEYIQIKKWDEVIQFTPIKTIRRLKESDGS